MRRIMFQFSGWSAGLLTAMSAYAFALGQVGEGCLYLAGIILLLVLPWLCIRLQAQRPEITNWDTAKRGYPQIYYPHSRGRK